MKRRTPTLGSEEQTPSSAIKRTKVQAQRKFAQGSNNFVYTSAKISSNPADSSILSTVQATPPNNVKKDNRELNNFSSLPTIDDFLTFLCFRETEVLPERLNYLNTPQFNSLPSKKKSVKSNAASFRESKMDNGLESNNKNDDKSKLPLKKKIKNVQEYKLRSYNIKNNIVRKPSHSLAIKHNQRLRSKTVVKAKCCDNKLQNLKSKSSSFTRLVPRPSLPVKSSSQSQSQPTKVRPLTRAIDKLEIRDGSICDNDFKRITRRNSTIDRNDSLSEHCANQIPIKPNRIKPVNNASKKTVIEGTKKSGKLLKISLPKLKADVTDASTDSTDTPSKPVTRSSRSGSVVQETPASSINVRPSRKTKEAAALYMEMLGKELLCPDESFEDDDDISIDSFPELPNAEEHCRREKELKEMHLRKTFNKLPSRKTSTPKLKTMSKIPSKIPDPEPCDPLMKALPKNVSKPKSLDDSPESEEAKKKGLCTRSKQYKTDLPLNNSMTRKEQSVKIIRTRLKNDVGANLARRNSCNDVFDVTKRVSSTFAKGKEPCKAVKNENDGCVMSQDKKPEIVAESVTIKRLTVVKHTDDKVKKSNIVRSRVDGECKAKKDLGLILPRRSSEPVIIEPVSKSRYNDEFKMIKSFVLEINEDNEAEPVSNENVCSTAKHFNEKMNIQKIRSSSCVALGSDPVIIERIPSRKNSELMKATKRNNSNNTCINVGDKDTTAILKNDAARSGIKNAMDSKVAELDRKASIAETKSKIATHNMNVKSQKPIVVDGQVKKIIGGVDLKSAQMRNNYSVKLPNELKSHVVDSKIVGSLPLVNDAENLKKKPASIAVKSPIIDSDDEFLIPPKILKCPVSTNEESKRTELFDHTDVSSTDDDQMLEKIPSTLSKHCVINSDPPKTVACEVPSLRSEFAVEKTTKTVPKVKATNSVVLTKKSLRPLNDNVVDSVKRKCDLLNDECDNQTFALDSYDDGTEDYEKNSLLDDATSCIIPKQELVVSSSKNLDFKKPVAQKSFFSPAIKSKTTTKTEEKPIVQSVACANQKVFNIESKKIIFKKNACSTPTSTELKDENISKKSEAFSPDNENSVYAFEPDLPTTSPPFRRLKPVTPPKTICSNSIAVQVNFEHDAKIECSSSGDTQVSSTTDCGDRVFYIPIQTSADTTSTLGVAVKLGTDGPNQKIIMSAKLITDSTTFTTNSASTSVSSKSTYVETSCTQTETIRPSTIEHIPKKVESTMISTTKKGNSEKVVTSTAGEQTIQIPCSSAYSLNKLNKKPSTIVTKSNSQSVKIVKLNKNKKFKDLKRESLKSKTRPVKHKSGKKLNAVVTALDADKPPSMPIGEILDAPTFYPTAEQFNDPMEYIDTIRPVAEKFGLCRIVPPANFRPECKVADEMRFTAYNQYVHKMLHRWGPNVKEMMAIKKFLSTQNITLTHAPWIGGMEVDLPRLYQIVQQCGGLNSVIEKERWSQVADIMKIPKLAQDRITKLDDIYCKYLLPYDVLSHDEREKLFVEIEKEWLNHLKNSNDDDDVFEDVDECIVKGRTMPLSCFYRIARNTMMMCFGNMEGQDGPSTEKIEEEFWNHVSKRKSHVCVHSGSIDSGTYGYGFSMAKNSTFRKHPWNLKVLTNNSASILRSLGPVMGVTVPTLHVGMLYSACCWYRDPHGLPWIEYLHTGANKIWYGIPDEHSEQFKEAMLLLVPRYCRDKKIWLPSDTVMIPPPLLTAQNISLSRVVQHPGQFIVVFPKAFTSSISTGYLVSESVYFAHAPWLNSAKQVFKDMQDSCEPSVFSLEQLLISIAEDARASLVILNKVLPLLIDLQDSEVALRNQLKELGLNTSEKMSTNKKRKSKSAFSDDDMYECEVCRANLFVSWVENSHDQSCYCLRHAATLLYKKSAQAKHCKLLYAYTEDELQTLIGKVTSRIEVKSGKKSQTK